MPSGSMKVAGVVGWPVTHSLSPKLHHYWLSHYGIDGVYVPLAVKPEDLHDVIKALAKSGFQGVNLTLPHKVAVLPFLDAIDEEATSIGAVNTIVVKDGVLHGYNTDSYGFIENIRPYLSGSKTKAVILGAGGAANAVCYALIKEGFSHIVVTNRTLEAAHALAKQFDGISVEPWDKRSDCLKNADLLVNTTSLGMQGKEQLDITLDALPLHALVTDIVYTPLMTPLLSAAQTRGNAIVDGLGMLLYQAVPGFKAWFGTTPEVTALLRNHMLHE